MKKNIKLFLIITVIFCLSGFINAEDIRKVTTESGLRMRENPEANAKVITTIPYNENLVVLEETGEQLTISGATGKWCKVKWNNKTGWVFGGFLDNSSAGSKKYNPEGTYYNIDDKEVFFKFNKNGTWTGQEPGVGDYIKSNGTYKIIDDTICLSTSKYNKYFKLKFTSENELVSVADNDFALYYADDYKLTFQKK